LNQRIRVTASFASLLCLVSLGFAANPRQSPIKRGPVPGQSGQAKFEFIRGSIAIAGIERTYALHRPRSNQTEHPLALVLNFHGAGGTGEREAELTGLNEFADQRQFIVVYPDGLDHRWTGDLPKQGEPESLNDVLFVRALVDQLEKTYSINPDRIMATGISNGGAFAQQLACRAGSPFSAVVSVSGILNVADAAACAPDRPVHFTLFHGTADPILPFEGGELSLRDGTHINLLSVAGTMALWARFNKCQTQTQPLDVKDISQTPDGTQVQQIHYLNCELHGSSVLYKIIGGGHTWPGSSPATPNEAMGRISHQVSASGIIAALAGASTKIN
jgi:polyhydroxybutyrate depolymerase